MSNVIPTVMLADSIMEVFSQDLLGVASDDAYWGLLLDCERFLKGELDDKGLLECIEFIFGFDMKMLRKALRRYNKQWSEYNKRNSSRGGRNSS